MALLFIDGFDHYATADSTKKWDSTAGVIALDANGRRGGGSVTLTGGTTAAQLIKTVTSGATFILGFAFYFSTPATAARIIAAMLDAGTVQCDLRINADSTLSITRNGTALTNGTSINTLPLNSWSYIEWKMTIANSISAGSCKLRVNGSDWITVATSQDTQNTANASANQIKLGGNNTGVTFTADDLYICNAAGSTNNDFLGDCRIDTLYPTSDGNYSQFTPSTGTTHYTLVDEATPNTTDYNSSATLNQIDSYGMGNLPTSPSTVYGVQVNIAALKSDAGARGITPLIRSSTTDGLGTAFTLSTSQLYALSIYETDPNGSVAWTATSVNAAEVGVKVTT